MLANRRHLIGAHLIRLAHDLRTLHLAEIFLMDFRVHWWLRHVINICHVAKIHMLFEGSGSVYELLADFGGPWLLQLISHRHFRTR